MKSSFILGSISLFFTVPLINKVGIESLYTIRVLLLFVSIICVMKYLVTTINRYKKIIKEKKITSVFNKDGLRPPVKPAVGCEIVWK